MLTSTAGRQCRKVGEVAQASEVEESARSDEQVVLIEFDQPADEQHVECAITVGPTDVVDAGASDRPLVRNDGEHLSGCL
jgi:hypothetical protein